jgi:hypothetical protein
MAQSQYIIVANRNCKTHRPGTRLVYTGPRSGIAKGWNCVGRANSEPHMDPLTGLAW